MGDIKELPKEENWDDYWDANTDSRFTKRSWSKARMMNVLDTIVKEGMSVLDAGSGSGFFSNYFISKGCNVYSLDYSEDALKITRRLTGGKSKEYLKEDLLDPKFGEKYPKKFDIIFSDGLFEHFSEEDQGKIISNFINVKKDNGVITTFVPNRFSWWEVVRPIFMPGIKEDPFTMKGLEGLHKGLEIQRKGGLNVLPLPLSPDNIFGSKIGMILYVFAR